MQYALSLNEPVPQMICGLADPIIVHADDITTTLSSLSSKAVFDNAPMHVASYSIWNGHLSLTR